MHSDSTSVPHPIEQVPALTSLRFFAAALVVLFHYLPRETSDPGAWLRIVNHGYVGVSFFFVLSGFILAYTGGGLDFGSREVRLAYYARRLSRIYPAFIAALLLDWPLFAYYQWSTLPPVDAATRIVLITLVSLILLQAWMPWLLGALNAPSWTISVEMFLYANLPWLMRTNQSMRTAWRVGWCVLALALCWVPAMIEPWVNSWFPESSAMPLWCRAASPVATSWLGSFPPFHLPQFFVGVLAGLFGRGARMPEVGTGWRMAGIAGLIALALSIPRDVSRLYDVALNNGALAGAFALLFIAIARAPHAALMKPLNWRPLVLLGDASYALYIFQMPVMKWNGLLFDKLGFSTVQILRFVVGFSVLIVVSLFSLKMEQWARPRLMKRVMKQFGATG